MLVRPASRADSLQIAALLPDLGYSANELEVSRRLQRLVLWPDNQVLVAEVGADIVGLCHVQGVPLVASDGYAEVQALVVSAAAQRQGIGRALVTTAVNWAAKQGYARVRLRSGLHRTDAHSFYEAQGFSRSRPSYAFELTINAPPPA